MKMAKSRGNNKSKRSMTSSRRCRPMETH